MIVYLWAVPGGESRGQWSGVTDDQATARRAVEAWLLAGLALIAYIEVAVSAFDARTCDPCYERTGDGWWAHRPNGRDVVWVPLTACGTDSREHPIGVLRHRDS